MANVKIKDVYRHGSNIPKLYNINDCITAFKHNLLIARRLAALKHAKFYMHIKTNMQIYIALMNKETEEVD